MYWLEKLDIIKKKYPAPAFKDMFREGPAVVEKIIRIFHNATCMTFKTATENFESLIKEIKSKREITILELENKLIDSLEENKNYWLFIVDIPMGNKFQVYDCQKEALSYTYQLASRSFNHFRFYIVDKKYEWMYYIDMYRSENTAYIYKSKNGN